MSRWCGGLVLLTASLCAMPSEAQRVDRAAPATLDLPAFIATLDQITALIDAPAPLPGRVRDLVVAMPSLLRVRHGGQQFEVPLEPLAGYLVSDPLNAADHLTIARRQIHALREQAAALLAADAALPTGDLRPRLQSILDRREYSRLRGTSWWAVARQRIGEWLMSWFQRLGGDGLDTRTLGTVLAWTVLVVAAGALLFVYHRRTGSRNGRLAGRDDVAPATAARAWGLRALAAARAGDAAEAVRAGYQAAVVQFSERGLWRVDEARTAREYLDLLGPGEAMRPIFADVAGQFERVFYGHRSLSAGDLARFLHDLETLGCVPVQQPSI